MLIVLFATVSLFNMASAQYKIMLNFNGANGSTPVGSLLPLGNKFYVYTQKGGSGYGNIFSIDKNGKNDNSFYNFAYLSYPEDKNVLVCAGHKLYGMTTQGGLNNTGNIFCIDTSGANYKDLWDFGFVGSPNGANPDYNGLIISNGRLYGMTIWGGVNKAGNIFGIDTDGTHYKDLYDFSATSGDFPQGSLTLVNNDQLYGMTPYGGAHGYGTAFSIDTAGGDFQDRWDFNFSVNNGANPEGSLIVLGNRMYGMTSAGGLTNYGVIFSLDTNAHNNSFKKLWDFDGGGDTNGSQPEGDLTYSGKVFYGMTAAGGKNYVGNIFRIDTDGSRYTNLWDCSFASGYQPYGNVTVSGGAIYGMTPLGGANNEGVIYTDTIISLNVTDTAVTCKGGNNGYATVYVSGGRPPFNYSWTGGSTTNKESGLSAGTYTVSVTDNTGLVATTAVTITQPAINTSITIASNTNEACNGDQTASVTANAATGGVSPYIYNWSPNGGTTLTASNLVAGIYTITATDNNGCTATAGVSITQPTTLSINMALNTNEACNGDQTASATANAAIGGTSSYVYSWSPSGGANLTASDLVAGTYTVTATDNHGCTATTSVSITQPAPLSITMASNTNEPCYGDQAASATASAAIGGTSPYTYKWSPGGSTNLTQSGLSIGTYSITVTDNHGCMATTSVSITQPTILGGTIYSTPDSGSNSGSAAINPAGGTTPYTYYWNPGAETIDSIIHISWGTYTITLTDNNGCTYSAVVTVDNTTGIASVKSGQNGQISVYPNPSGGMFTFRANSNQTLVNSRIEIYNMLGEQIYLKSSIMTLEFSINISNQPNGLYMYRIISETGDLRGQGKLIIQW